VIAAEQTVPDASIKSPPITRKLRAAFGYERLAKLLRARRAPVAVALLAFAMTLPAMTMGMVADDYTLAGQVKRDPLSAYAFEERDPELRRASVAATRDTGYSPWWVDEEFHLAFLRPLASLSLALDFNLWPHATWLMVIENALLFAGVVLLVARLYQTLELPPIAAGFAMFIYALKPDQSMSTGWIAGRNTLMAAFFGVLAILAYVEARRARLQPGAETRWTIVAVVAYGCALLSGEIGVSAGAFLFAHACTREDGPLPKRLLRLWPFALLVVCWYTTYRLLGYGSAGSGFYIEPGRDPLRYLWGVITGVPIYLATQLTYPVASLASLSEAAFWVTLGGSLAALYLSRNLLVPLLRANRTARFLALGSVIAVIPLGTSLPADRLTYFIGFGTSGLIGLLLTQRLGPSNLTQPRWGARLLYHIHVLWLPLLYIPVMFAIKSPVLGGGAIALEQALPRDGQRAVVLVNGPSHLSITLQRDMRDFLGAAQVPAIDMLYAGGMPVRLHRASERVLELEVMEGYLANAFERVMRDPARKPFRAGDTLELPRMRVTVLQVNAQGAPTRVRFALNFDPAQSDTLWLAWLESGPVPYQLPALGETVELPGIGALLPTGQSEPRVSEPRSAL
jgi:hypothetical protein